MSRDPRKAQQAKERRNKRAKEKQKAAARQRSASPLAVLDKIEQAAFVRCAVYDFMTAQGMTNLFVWREFPNGPSVAVVFLLDVFCLGVKDAFAEVGTHAGVLGLYKKVFHSGGAVLVSPEEAKKLCLGAVAYAAGYGLSPHPDYNRVCRIFAGVDESACPASHTFGKDGKPFYIAGPNDGPSRRRAILSTLERTAGPGGYDFLLPTGGPPGGEFDEEEFDDEEFDDDLPDGPAPFAPRKW